MKSHVNYVAPVLNGTAFNCPSCGAYANQRWERFWFSDNGYQDTNVTLGRCLHCSAFSVWYGGRMLQPSMGVVEAAHVDLPSDCLDDYNEAKDIFERSPRGAAALLRLVIQKLMVHLEQPGKNIDSDIKALVKSGLPLRVQQALDVCRVVGNNAVHPGAIDLQADPSQARALFGLVNYIVQDQITRPREVEELFEALPEGAREAITKRDRSA